MYINWTVSSSHINNHSMKHYHLYTIKPFLEFNTMWGTPQTPCTMYNDWLCPVVAGIVKYMTGSLVGMCTVSNVSYRYHQTDTGIVSKWQINDTFMMLLIRIELVWHKNIFFYFFIKCMFCFSFLHYLENYSPWILYCMRSTPKGQKEKVNSLK